MMILLLHFQTLQTSSTSTKAKLKKIGFSDAVNHIYIIFILNYAL